MTRTKLKKFTLDHIDTLSTLVGIALACVGLWLVYPPAGVIGAGAGLIWLGYPDK